jgi:signal transduction histidine kinase
MITGIVGYGFFKGDQMNKAYAPLVDAAMEIKFEATLAHLWFEEIISGDRHEDISEVWKHQDQAEWYAKAMLQGGKNQEGTFIPLDNAEMRRKIKKVQGRLKEFRGITQKRLEAIEAQLRQAQKMESIGTLAAGIAHDFNNILSSVIGYTELALEDAERNTVLEDRLQEIYTAGHRAKNLVKQILTFSRQTEQERKPVQVTMIVNEVLKLLRASLPSTIEVSRKI